MHVKWAVLLVLLSWHSGAAAQIAPIQEHIPNAQLKGKGGFNYLFMHIYDASLYAPEGDFDQAQPFALELVYKRELDGADIADESIRQMRKQGWKDEAQLTRWRKEMAAIFPNVKSGDSLTGVSTTDHKTQFYKDAHLIGQVDDSEFGKAFFGIWLNERTTEPGLRRKLLGIVE